MSSIPENLADKADAAQASGLSEADRALLLAMRAWAGEIRARPGSLAEKEEEHGFILKFWDWLEPGWIHRLCAAWDRQARSGDRLEANQALNRLRRMHVSSVRAELGHVHPSWLVRALQEESPAVKRLVAASVPDELRNPIQAGLLLDSQDLVTERPIQPMFRQWVMGLWTERLVGGEQARDDDPPALVAICGLSARAGYRLCRMAGLAKSILASEKPGKGRTNRVDRAREEWFHGRLDPTDSEFRARAGDDVRLIARMKLPRRLHAARIGLFTFARLLAVSEPFRLRWALQHWPYPIVKLTRSLMSDASSRTPGVLAGETLLLKSAWERLTLEGRLTNPWPDRSDDNEIRLN
jgi:hypothetical protein